jgi:hypothetical protein
VSQRKGDHREGDQDEYEEEQPPDYETKNHLCPFT